jgi:Holliday junction DNA helicase RuvB
MTGTDTHSAARASGGALDEAADPGEAAVPRPARLSEFTGQAPVKANLEVYVSSALKLGVPLDHVLLYGPPGTGKTTLAQVVANEMGVGYRTISAPAVAKASDLVSTLMALEERDVLFIDEIHRLPTAVEEVLYSVMEDFRLDVVVGDQGQGRSVSVPLPRFTLVGATTRPGMLTTPLLDRFGIPLRLELYTVEEMEAVLARAAGKISMPIDADALSEVASRSRGTPRIGLRLLRRVRDFAVHHNGGRATEEIASMALSRLGVDPGGLDEADRRYLSTLRGRFKGGPVGLSTLAAALEESQDTVEFSIEPFLIRAGLVDRTRAGRVAREVASAP